MNRVWVGYVMLFSLVTAGASVAAPVDNPVSTFYDGPEGYPAWTDGIHWAKVIDMAAYRKGRTHFEKFENARDELAGKGGGEGRRLTLDGFSESAGEVGFRVDGRIDTNEMRALSRMARLAFRLLRQQQAKGSDWRARETRCCGELVTATSRRTP